jgi:Tfp pilus assembly protein FimT
MPLHRRRTAAFTLLELLLVVIILALLAAVLLPSMEPSLYDQLRSAAQIVATDLAYARSLAVANNDAYKITFNLNANQYVLKHSGGNAALNQLPKTPFSTPADPSDQHIVDLDNLPNVGATVFLAAVATVGTATQSVSDVEFGPLGQTTRTDPTTIWLMARGSGGNKYMTLQVSPVTGLTQIGAYSSVRPPAAVTQIQ